MGSIDIRLLAPIIILELLMKVVALTDLARRSQEQVRGPRWLWALLILFVSMLGWVVYLVWGRDDQGA
jgi:uncharacterized membrane protein YozB (DUF420 family)